MGLDVYDPLFIEFFVGTATYLIAFVSIDFIRDIFKKQFLLQLAILTVIIIIIFMVYQSHKQYWNAQKMMRSSTLLNPAYSMLPPPGAEDNTLL